MSQSKRVAVVVGSLRAESFSRKVARALMARAPKSLECQLVEIGDLPLYNEDLENDSPPAAWTKFRKEIGNADAILFVTPEYNRSLPGCLKNAIDVGSRPEKKSVFDGLPVGVVSDSPYELGGFGANHALRQTFVFLNMRVMQQPEAYIGKISDRLDNEGGVQDKKTDALLTQFMTAFDEWIRTVSAAGKAPDFAAFMKTRETIARDYVNGEAASLGAIVTRTDPATFFSPKGDTQQGAEAIASRYETDAQAFQKGSTTKLEVLQSSSGELAFWTGLQHAMVRMKGQDAVPMTLRITEVFRREGGSFKLVHRHADMGAKPKGG
jgi:NAD(P)H-dependent FMN reductase/ketosteroid isomerase-like protein